MNISSTTIEGTLKYATIALIPTSTTPRLDAEIILAHVLHTTRSYLYSHNEQSLSSSAKQNFATLLKARQHGKPIAYILGSKEFWSLELKVTKDVLIPRPETELLVELCLNLLDKNKKQNIADLGTGSGAIALALAYERPNWQITALDNNLKALKLAQLNANNLNISNVNFLCSNWYDALPQAQKFDAILSNPPYIPINDPHLQRGDVAHEPKNALISGTTGLDDFLIIIANAKKHLDDNGIILLEHGYNQRREVKKLLHANGFSNIKTYTDLSKQERVTTGYFKQ